MGDIADMIFEGGMCQWCGEILDGDGFPTICNGCQEREKTGNRQCPTCYRQFCSNNAMRQHHRAKHGGEA